MRSVLRAWVFVALGLMASPAFAVDTVYYYSSDTIHSEVVVTDASRNVVERTYYAPYGQVLNRDLRDGPGYSGHEEDPETNLVYMQQRYYDPEAGRFLSTDPVQADGGGGSFNRYEYAKDDPYRFTDPDGRQSCTGSNLGHCEGENLTVYQVGEPSAPSAKIAHEMVSNKPADRVSAAHSAMNYFGIKPISGTVDIHYNAQMSRQVYGDIIYVKGQGVLTLGPSAYITWAHLGSTLGHEINVHWNMQMLIFQRNAVDSHERDRWEMEAYMYNIRNANRFGNSPGDIAEFNELYQDYKYDLEHRPDSLDVSLH